LEKFLFCLKHKKDLIFFFEKLIFKERKNKNISLKIYGFYLSFLPYYLLDYFADLNQKSHN